MAGADKISLNNWYFVNRSMVQSGNVDVCVCLLSRFGGGGRFGFSFAAGGSGALYFFLLGIRLWFGVWLGNICLGAFLSIEFLFSWFLLDCLVDYFDFFVIWGCWKCYQNHVWSWFFRFCLELNIFSFDSLAPLDDRWVFFSLFFFCTNSTFLDCRKWTWNSFRSFKLHTLLLQRAQFFLLSFPLGRRIRRKRDPGHLKRTFVRILFGNWSRLK